MKTIRVVWDFSQGWRFRFGNVERVESPDFDDSDWETVDLPHTWNATDTATGPAGYRRGTGWYRKQFSLTRDDLKKRIGIGFGGACTCAEVWVNGTHTDTVACGFAGFEADISGKVVEGRNVIAVSVDNGHNPDIPPGIETPDYNIYGGLYRGATLTFRNLIYIPEHGVAITTPSVSRNVSTLTVGVVVRNARQSAETLTCTASVSDAEGELVMEKREAHRLEAGTERLILLSFPAIRETRLWSVDSPYLYTLLATVEQGKTVLDDVETSFGFRALEFTRDNGFFLNGERIQLRGVNRHEDYPGLGNAAPRRLQRMDAQRIKDMGCNFVRTSHYPQDTAFLDACDRLGILVYEEITSWQFIGGKQFANNLETVLRRMIVRDKNHPSIIMWGLFNEGRDRDMLARLNGVAHRMDPTRPTVYAENEPGDAWQRQCAMIPDVLGINYKLPHIDDIHSQLPDVKLLSSEHTNADQSIRGDIDRELEQVNRIKTDLDIIEARPYLAGGALWSMHDYATEYEPVRPIQRSGVMDEYRLPKAAFYYLKCRWSTRPMLYICGHWTWPGYEGRQRTVAVVNNCDSVELFLNDVSLGIQHNANPACRQVEYEPGTLLAVGIKDGRKGQKVLRTAGAPAALKVGANPGAIAADGKDVAVVTVWVADSAGTVVPCSGDVEFRLEGPARLREIGGEPKTQLKSGIGGIFVQSLTKPGSVTVFARYGDLAETSVVITTR